MPDTSTPHHLITLLVMAGGRSRRMGRDKAWLEIDGLPLVERVVQRLAGLAGEVLFSAREPEPYAALCNRLSLPAAVALDRYPDAGPLAGLEAGLAAAAHELVFSVATDMPFVNPSLVRHLLSLSDGYDAVVPLTPHGDTLEPEPLHAVYRRTCLPDIRAQLDAGRRRVVSFLPEVRVRYVTPDEMTAFDPDLRSFANINTPEEWEEQMRNPFS
jgi:molybdopterin-guanine dinucleotide biosynthesis protein A